MRPDAHALRVLVVAADPLARGGIAAMLAQRPGLTVVGQVDDGPSVESALEAHRPDVAVWDMAWSVGDAVERLADLAAELPVVALVSTDEDAHQAWDAGVRGVLLRDADGERLAAALSAVEVGLHVLDPRAASTHPTAGGDAPELAVGELTPREVEVLGLMAEGLPNKAISQRLAISEHTVKFHVNAILGKMGARSRTEAVTRATRLGLILL